MFIQKHAAVRTITNRTRYHQRFLFSHARSHTPDAAMRVPFMTL